MSNRLRHLINNFLTLLGFFLIGWTIFNRLFRIRLPKDVPTEFTSYWQLIYILLFMTSLLSCIAIIFSISRMLKKPKEEEKPDSWLKRWLKPVFTQLGEWATNFGDWYYGLYNRAYQEIIIFLPLKVRVWFDDQLFALGVWATLTTLDLIEKKRFMLIMLTILLCTEILPYLIVATVLFIDVYYLGKFQYFYVSLYLMIIPVTWKALLAMLKEIATSTMKNLSKYIRYKPVDPANPKGEWTYFATVEGQKHSDIYVKYDWKSREIMVFFGKVEKVREEFHILLISARLLTGLFYASSWGLIVCKIWVF